MKTDYVSNLEELFITQAIDIFTGEIIYKRKSYKLKIIRGDKLIIEYFSDLETIRVKMEDDSRYKEYCGDFYLFNVD